MNRPANYRHSASKSSGAAVQFPSLEGLGVGFVPSRWSSRKILLCVCGLAAAMTANAVTDNSNPYERIVERNVFNLKAPPRPEDLLPPPTPPPKITLQGISSILGHRKVLFKTQPSKPGDKEQSYILSEGQREDEVEVLAIDEKEGSIKFNNHGTVQTLTMDKDASKPPSVASVPPAGIPRPVSSAVPAFGGNTAAPGGNSMNNMTTIGSGNQGLRQIPSRTLRTAPSSSGATIVAPTAQSTMTHEEETILLEVERARTKAQVEAGELPPLPPTELTPPGSKGMPEEGPPTLPK